MNNNERQTVMNEIFNNDDNNGVKLINVLTLQFLPQMVHVSKNLHFFPL